MILDERKRVGDDKIIINANLASGLPLENMNKIAGPMIEAWVGDVFSGIRDHYDNEYCLIDVEAQERLGSLHCAPASHRLGNASVSRSKIFARLTEKHR